MIVYLDSSIRDIAAHRARRIPLAIAGPSLRTFLRVDTDNRNEARHARAEQEDREERKGF